MKSTQDPAPTQRISEAEHRELKKKCCRFEQLMLHSRDGYVVTDWKGRFVDANPSYLRMLGYSLNELRSITDFYTITPENWHEWERTEIVEKKLLKEGYTGIYRKEYQRKNGEIFPVELQAFAITPDNGDEPYFWATVREISARAEMEDELNMVSQAVNDSLNAFCVLNESAEIIYINRACVAMWGCRSVEAVIGTHPGEYFKTPDVLNQLMDDIREHDHAQLEVKALTDSGETFDVVLYGKLSKTHTDELIYPITMIDVTEHNRIQADLRSSQQQLQERIEELELLNRGMTNLAEDMQFMNLSLETTTNQLVEANQELEAFSYTVSHDLRAPLRTIRGYVDILQEDHASELQGTAREVLNVVHESAEKMDKLIDDILTLSRLGRRSPTRSGVNSDGLVEEILAEIKVNDEDGIRWKVESLPDVHADRSLLKHAMTNLVRNAMKFSSKKDLPEISIFGKSEGSHGLITVADNGVGFDPKQSEKIFDVFKRLHHERDYPGTGIGLAIVKRIVERHDGSVHADAVPGKGATFTMRIPLAEQSRTDVNPIATGKQQMLHNDLDKQGIG